MTDLFTRHRPLLESALKALETREFWTPFPEVPSGKIYGETAKDEGESSYAALLGAALPTPQRSKPEVPTPKRWTGCGGASDAPRLLRREKTVFSKYNSDGSTGSPAGLWSTRSWPSS